MARLCTMIRRDELSFDDFRRRRHYVFLRLRAHNWQVLYNCACCIGRLLPDVPVDRRPEWIEKAIDFLDDAYHDSNGAVELGWIATDPDLELLRSQPKYAQWLQAHRDPPKRLAGAN
jgi:hypothetical protein